LVLVEAQASQDIALRHAVCVAGLKGLLERLHLGKHVLQLLLGRGGSVKAGSVGAGLAHQGAEEIARRDEVDDQLPLNEALAVGHIVELGGAIAELGDQVVTEIPLDGLKLVNENAVDE
jgi:hypothetical protein